VGILQVIDIRGKLALFGLGKEEPRAYILVFNLVNFALLFGDVQYRGDDRNIASLCFPFLLQKERIPWVLIDGLLQCVHIKPLGDLLCPEIMKTISIKFGQVPLHMSLELEELL